MAAESSCDFSSSSQLKWNIDDQVFARTSVYDADCLFPAQPKELPMVTIFAAASFVAVER